ncbi:MAG: ABC transporter ATP-binding protein [Spirochaetales bacterium]|nr:ABC transporter ATP-binding protein [Spirochaetales bacterium]
MGKNILLEVKDLKTYFHTEEGVVRAVNGVTYTLHEGETLGIVGESGCGKSVSSYSIMGLVESPPGKIHGGEIHFRGKNLLDLDEREFSKVRGRDMAMIFQEPMTALNPIMTCGEQIREALKIHTELNKKEQDARIIELLTEVGIPAPEKRMHAYPHELSGGMRQRVVIAIALSCNPSLLIADEPTTALDVTIQAQIMELMKKLQKKHRMAIILITHDLAVVAEAVDRVAVMYAGEVVENAPVRDIYKNPRHPYTQALLASIPELGHRDKKIEAIPGRVPNLMDEIKGCPFRNRCKKAMEICRTVKPELKPVGEDHLCRCLLYGEEKE